MTVSIRRAADVIKRHSRLVNLARNLLHLMHRRRVSPAAWLLIDGSLQFGRHATVSRGCQLTVPTGSSLLLGEHVWLNHDVKIDVLNKIVIGAHTSLQRHCSVVGDVEIGRGCLFAPNVFVSSGAHHFDTWPALPIRVQEERRSADPALRPLDSRTVQIGDDCWLGVNAVVQPGVTVGRGAVIGANAVVTRDVPPYSVVGGVPARLLRSRLEFAPPLELDGMCERLLPYFYSGFEYGGALPPVADGDFVLSLALEQAHAVRLTLRGAATSPVEVVCGGARCVVPVDESVEFKIALQPPCDSERLEVSLPNGGRVAVLHAMVLYKI
jgi:acetyltransferase-like isoleucine patch superfamily enzyme